MSHWTAADIPWDEFDPARVDSDILQVVKAAAMVERNAGDYARYLCNVFPDDPEFATAARGWSAEEVQHGEVLGRWVRMADADFDFEARFGRFLSGYRIAVDAEESVRGSRSGELVARCVVEVGTSSYYTALGAATDEPVLKAICARIAADEFRHYKMFYGHLKRYTALEKPSRWQKIRVVFGRIFEVDDDELAYAWYAANGREGEVYDRRSCAGAYKARAYSFYRPAIVNRSVAMTLKAAGLRSNGRLARLASAGAWKLLDRRQKQAARVAA